MSIGNRKDASLHILIASKIEPHNGGCETWLGYFLPEIKKEFKSTIVHHVAGGIGVNSEAGIIYRPLKARSAISFCVKAFFSLVGSVRKGDYTLAIGSYEAAWPIVIIKVFRKIRMIVWIREKHLLKKSGRRPWLTRLFRKAERATLKASELVVYNGDDTRAYYNHEFPGVATNSAVIPNAVRVEEFSGVPIEKSPGKIRLAYMGRFVQEKGFDFVLDLKTRLDQDDRFDFLLYGYGTEDVERALIRDCIPFSKYSPSELPELFATFEGVVFANKEKEGSSAAGVSHSLLEAMAAGRLVLAARNVIHTQVLDEECAVLYQEDSVEDLVHRLYNLTPEKMKSMMFTARNRAKMYSIQAHLARFMDALI